MQIRVGQLYDELSKAVKQGLSDKLIVISNDSEGNGYHGLFYGITSGEDAKEILSYADITDSESENPDELVILG